MNPYFKGLKNIPPCDEALRDAIKGKKVKKAIHLIHQGANVNGQYPDDWNTPLHTAILEGWDEQMIQQLMSCNPDYGLVNGKDLIAAELALQQGNRSIVKQLIEAELKRFQTPEEACYEMMKRNSVEVMDMLLDCLALPNQELVNCLTKAWRRLEVMNVMVRSDVEALVHLRVMRHDYDKVLYTKMDDIKEDKRIELMMNDIDRLLGKFDTGLGHDISDEFITTLRDILKQLFVVKDRIKWFPATKLEFCIAIYLAIFDRAPELDLFRLIVHKAMIVRFLKQFRDAYGNSKYGLEARMTDALLTELVKVVLTNKNQKCKQILNAWLPFMQNKYKLKEQIMLRNFIVKNFNDGRFSDQLNCKANSNDRNKFIAKSIEINNMFNTRRIKYKYQNLFRTYFKLKQTHSMDKVEKCLIVVKSIDLNCEAFGTRLKVSMLAMQRAIQIIGETFKSTQLSANISKALSHNLASGAPGLVLTRTIELRDFFSHNFSWTKHSIYDRLKWNDPKFVELYKSVQTDLLTLHPMLVNFCASNRQRNYKTFLGSVLQLSTADEVCSFATDYRKNFPRNIQIEHDANDVNRLDETLELIEACCKQRNLQEHYHTVVQVRSELSAFKRNIEKIKFDDVTLDSSIEMLISNQSIVYQRYVTRRILTLLSPTNYINEYGISSIFRHVLPKLRMILELNLIDAKLPISIIGPFLELDSSTAIDSYCTKLSKISNRNINDLLQISRLKLAVDDHQQGNLTELLKPYCKSMFSIDGKYSTVKKFCKDNHVYYSKQLMEQSRATDMQCFQNMFEDLVQQVGEILSLSNEVGETEFVSMLDSYEGNQSEIMASEMILLDILGILCERGVLLDFRASMLNQRPIVTGRNLRNYIAHDNLVYDVICSNKNSKDTILLNAYCLYRYLRINIYDQQQHHRIILEPNDSLDLIRKVQIKQTLVLAIEQGQFEEIDLDAVESKFRTVKNSTILEIVALKQPNEFLRFILGDSSRMKPLMDFLIRKSPNQRHSFNVFNVSIHELIHNELLQADLNAYFSTSLNRLQDLKGSKFSNQSLLNAISRRNELFALSIINNPYFYGSSDKQNSSGTILTLSVAKKMIAVVRRLCEVDPQIVKQTNFLKQSALDVAMMTGSIEMVRFLLNFHTRMCYSSTINALQLGMSAIFHSMMKDKPLLNNLLKAAAETNNTEILNEILPLVDSKASIQQALCKAILQNNIVVVRKILHHSSEVINDCDFNNSPLIIACHINSTKMINLLLEYGADCNLPTDISALHYVIDHGRRSIFKIFLQQGKINEELKATLFERCLQAFNPKMALMTYKANCPYTLTAVNIRYMQKLLPKMYHSNPVVLHRLNGNMLALAILFGMHAFVKHIFCAMFPRMSKHDLARCLICAIKANNVPMVQFLLDQGCDVNQADSNGLTPLTLSATLGSEVLIETLLRKGANPDLESVAYCKSMTIAWKHGDVSFEQVGGQRFVTFPLIIALRKKFYAIAVKLIQHGANTEIYDCDGFSPLVVAIINGDYRQVKMLIDSGANVRYAKDFSHPERCKGSVLHTVAFFGHIDVFKLLIEEHGFDPMVTDHGGNTTLHTAVANQQASIVEYILESQCRNVVKRKLNNFDGVQSFRSSSGRSLLHMAVSLENIQLVRTLIDNYSFDLNCCDTEGFAPIHYAINLGNLEIIRKLLKSGATLFAIRHNQTQLSAQVGMWLTRKFDVLRLFMSDPESVDALKSYHLVNSSLLISAILVDNYASCKLLLAFKEFDQKILDEYGNSTLHWAVYAGSVRIAALLLNCGLFIDAQNVKNDTPLMLALDMNDGKMANYLFGKGASKSSLLSYRVGSNPTKTLLHWFAEEGKLNALCFLIKRKIFPSTVKDAEGWTIGHYAAANNQQHVIDYLSHMSFPFDDTDKDDRSCLVCAIENGHLELAKKLFNIDCSLSLVKQYNEKKSLLKIAIMKKQKSMVRFLIEKCCLES